MIVTPPPAVSAYRREVEDGLGDGWAVGDVCFDRDVPDDPALVSAALVASTEDGAVVAFSRHLGTDSVHIEFRGGEPVPFEDLAVAKHVLRIEALLAHARVDAGDDRGVQPLVPFERILRCLADWRDEIPHDLDPENQDMADELHGIADSVMEAAGFME